MATPTPNQNEQSLEKGCDCNAESICRSGCMVIGTTTGNVGAGVSKSACKLGCAPVSGCEVDEC
ncbi:hypothetical protein N7448_004223 [Penicillium atrosanguineum]|uniref:Uncharacterized protein n=1 Tax=Penicillium atrosanguineum TaxID=1132637 RepID=A0A9W9H8S2_9EURO|nr:uncharacterized protein N7443_003188 [Penicillium atrosanguineum]KAJ5140815.1 hypothetical protein N7448_004223 [Penicillium atrosanguineum]KAJ5310727.1 hypothetical protein N7443_003188 [Penicillium atrosanguineum]KAJ5316250.1 hypothetical protein N7476_006557 [Penicillium atrosanguineum]